MSYLSNKKAETSHEFRKLFHRVDLPMEQFLDTIIDSIVSEVEQKVVPEERTGFKLDDDVQNYKWMGQNEAREKVLEAFKHLREEV